MYAMAQLLLYYSLTITHTVTFVTLVNRKKCMKNNYPLCRALFKRWYLFGLLILLYNSMVPAASESYGVNTDKVAHTYTTVARQGLPAVMELPLSALVGPGDVLRIKVFPDTGSFISGNYVVLDSGFVLLPILGFVQVTNRSLTALTDHLTGGYAKYLAFPSIQIEPMIRLSLLGGFIRPGMYLVNPLHPFANALSAAGGTIQDDGLKQLRWERNGKVLATDLTQMVEARTSLWALGFKSQDQVCVTLATSRDALPLASFIVSSIVAVTTLSLTLLVLIQ